MTDNLNINDNLYKWNTAKERREEPSGDMLPLHEEITISKTEVKEEVDDFDMSVDNIQDVFVKEEYFCPPEDANEEHISLPVSNFKEENLESIKYSGRLLNEHIEFGNIEFQEVKPQGNKYRCKLCHSNFDENIYLEKHYKQCPFTEQKLSKEGPHLKCNSADKKYDCAHCVFSTSVRSYFVKHVRIHAKTKPFKCTYKNCKCTPEQQQCCKCDTCEFAALRKSCLKRHILMAHSGEPKKYKCSHCMFATHLKSTLVQHIHTHSNNKPFKCTYKDCKCTPRQKQCCECDMCEYAAVKKNSLNRHILEKHSREPKKYKCKYCKYATHRKMCLEVHIRVHTNNRPFKCTYKNCKCTPEQEGPCKCDTCGYSAVKNYILRSHILEKHSEYLKKYKCNHCRYAADRKEILKQHICNHKKRTDNKLFKCTYKNCECTPEQLESCECDMCEYTALGQYTLKKHISEKHSDELKKFKCNDCEYAAQRKSSLEEHIRSHTNETPFKCTYKNCTCIPGQEQYCECDMCDFATIRKGSLNRHILAKHSGEPKKFKCNHCKYATYINGHLQRHIRIHSNDGTRACKSRY